MPNNGKHESFNNINVIMHVSMVTVCCLLMFGERINLSLNHQQPTGVILWDACAETRKLETCVPILYCSTISILYSDTCKQQLSKPRNSLKQWLHRNSETTPCWLFPAFPPYLRNICKHMCDLLICFTITALLLFCMGSFYDSLLTC